MDNITITKENIHIQDSCKIAKKNIPGIIDGLRRDYQDNEVIKARWRYSLVMEWVAHNFLYQIHYKRERTADVDLNLISSFTQFLYCVCGTLVYLFVK